MAEQTMFAPSPVQLPAIPTKAKGKKVIVVRRTTRPLDSNQSSSSVPTLPAIKQRESWTDRLSSQIEPQGAVQQSSDSHSVGQDPLPKIRVTSQTAAGDGPSAIGVGQSAKSPPAIAYNQSALDAALTGPRIDLDANPDEFGALILENAAASTSPSPVAEAFSEAAEKEGQISAAELRADVKEDYPPDIAAAIAASEDGGVAIREAYERRRQHRVELAMQVKNSLSLNQ
jgi:hypothetical protein